MMLYDKYLVVVVRIPIFYAIYSVSWIEIYLPHRSPIELN